MSYRSEVAARGLQAVREGAVDAHPGAAHARAERTARDQRKYTGRQGREFFGAGESGELRPKDVSTSVNRLYAG